MKMSKVAVVVAAVCLAVAGSAYAGGEMGDAKDAKRKDEGPRFFGFVRVGSGKPVPEAKVVAEIKNSTRYITHTGKNGMYSFNGFSKNVAPDDVTISCSLDNFRQERVIRKTPGGKAVKAVETECRLTKQ
jgi:hypothetical protein